MTVLGRKPTSVDFESFSGVFDPKPGLMWERDSHRQDSQSVDQGEALRVLATGSASAPNSLLGPAISSPHQISVPAFVKGGRLSYCEWCLTLLPALMFKDLNWLLLTGWAPPCRHHYSSFLSILSLGRLSQAGRLSSEPSGSSHHTPPRSLRGSYEFTAQSDLASTCTVERGQIERRCAETRVTIQRLAPCVTWKLVIV